MTTTTLSEADLEHLLALAVELDRAGRSDEATAVARAFAVLNEISGPDVLDEDADLDAEFVEDMEAAQRDIAAGRLIAHDEIMRRLQALDDG